MKKQNKWETLKSYIGLDDGIAMMLVIIGLLGFTNISAYLPHIPVLNDVYTNIRAELIGIGISVLIIANANEAVSRQSEKERLILQMGSPNNAFAIEAVRQLDAKGWLNDGTLRGAKLFKANLSHARLFEANLSGADLSKANLHGASLPFANLSGVDMEEANLNEADLNYAILPKARLCGAKLVGANLRKTYMREAQLNGVVIILPTNEEIELSGADLTGANLSEANLREANLNGTNLCGANLRGADLSEANLFNVKYDEKTIWPGGYSFTGK